jgi:hypothetical protein
MRRIRVDAQYFHKLYKVRIDKWKRKYVEIYYKYIQTFLNTLKIYKDTFEYINNIFKYIQYIKNILKIK